MLKLMLPYLKLWLLVFTIIVKDNSCKRCNCKLRDLSFNVKFFLYKQKMLIIKETDTFGHMLYVQIFTSHIGYFTPQHTAFEQYAACLSVFLESLPGLILFAIL